MIFKHCVPGPFLNDNTVAYGCPVPLNRTQVLILHHHHNNCIYARIYDFEKFNWIKQNHCYYNITVGVELQFHDIFQLKCTSIWSKNHMKIFVMAQCNSALDFSIIDLASKNAQKVPNPLVKLDYYSSIDSVSINGIIYLISSATEGIENRLQVHILQNETLIFGQSIQVDSYLANTEDQVVDAKDFSATSLLF